ncbi:disease resistance protein RPV1-like [Mangifera indica]|uniref:disease resistance protein RPV1-like n=1 Tax=Mangifera indica TaxID=29780 RepID=UPI001CFBC848|nr:disease resistance protein RPV1-like [Mangifera indica]
MASSLSSSSPSSTFSQGKYDVFLSFRGKDTRANFTSHLYAALCQKQIQTFIDDDALKRGDETPPALLKAIEESKISLIIFSKDYASSRWCLDELVKILECKKIKGQMVIPVFYNVNPSDIRHLTGNYKEAFVKHEEYFKGKKEKVQRFRTALTEASYLSGWDSSVTRPDSKLVDEIVKDILEKLNGISPLTDCEGLVGLESRIEQVKSLLCTGLSDSRVVVGIWGMGGIGKTTIAEAIFNQISCQFEGRCFIQNVREESEKCGGLARLREQVISQVLQERNLSIGIPNMIPPFIKHRLQCKRVFIILDDVNDSEQLEFLIGGIDRFGPGSRVIITTRDRQVLRNFEVDNIYEVEGFEHHEALQLFCNFAFKQNSPPNDFWELSNKVVLYYAKGNPLALKVVASSLHKKNKQYWESAVKKLNKTPSPKILNILRISYDGLDHEEKNIFLDIACFFKGKDRDQVIRILDGCYHSALSGLSDLIDKALISISSDNTLQMHDLLQEMGWEIVRKVSFNEPGTHSRLWNPEDVCSVLKNNTVSKNLMEFYFYFTLYFMLIILSSALRELMQLKACS